MPVTILLTVPVSTTVRHGSPADEIVRSLLLNAWAFWFVGTLALYAAIGLGFAALIVFLALLFELLVAPKREGVVTRSARTSLPGTTVPVPSSH